MSSGLADEFGGVDFKPDGALQLVVEVQQLLDKDLGNADAVPIKGGSFTTGSVDQIDQLFAVSGVSPHSALLAFSNNQFDYSLKAFQEGNRLTVTLMESTVMLKNILKGDVGWEGLKMQLLGFIVKSASVTKLPNGFAIKKLELAVTVISDDVLGAAVKCEPALSGMVGSMSASGFMLCDVAAGANAAATRAHAMRLSSSNSLDQLAFLPVAAAPAAGGAPSAGAPSKATTSTMPSQKDVRVKKEPGLAVTGRSVKAAAGRMCPSVAAASLRPGTNGEYGPKAGVDWKTMDKGGALIYQVQAPIIQRASKTYQAFMSDGLGVARQKDSPKELEKAEANGSIRGIGSKDKENKRVPASRALSEEDIANADLFAVGWLCAAGYTVEELLLEDGAAAPIAKLHVRYSKHHNGFVTAGLPRPRGEHKCVPDVLLPSDAATLYKNRGSNQYSDRAKAPGKLGKHLSEFEEQSLQFAEMRSLLVSIQAVLDKAAHYKVAYKDTALVTDLQGRMEEELEDCSDDKKQQTKGVWMHAIYGVMAHQGASWAEIGAMMEDACKARILKDMTKLTSGDSAAPRTNRARTTVAREEEEQPKQQEELPAEGGKEAEESDDDDMERRIEELVKKTKEEKEQRARDSGPPAEGEGEGDKGSRGKGRARKSAADKGADKKPKQAEAKKAARAKRGGSSQEPSRGKRSRT